MPDEASPSGLIDGVPPDAEGSREIGFTVPDRYNASAILFDNLMASGYRLAVTGPAGLRTYAELAADACAFGAGCSGRSQPPTHVKQDLAREF